MRILSSVCSRMLIKGVTYSLPREDPEWEEIPSDALSHKINIFWQSLKRANEKLCWSLHRRASLYVRIIEFSLRCLRLSNKSRESSLFFSCDFFLPIMTRAALEKNLSRVATSPNRWWTQMSSPLGHLAHLIGKAFRNAPDTMRLLRKTFAPMSFSTNASSCASSHQSLDK